MIDAWRLVRLAESTQPLLLVIMPTARKKIPKAPPMKQSIKRWGSPAIEAGFTLIPSTLLKYQHRLGLEPVELVVLLQIIQYWWKDDLPWPSQKTIAENMGRSVSTVHKIIAKLKERGLIDVHERYNSTHKGQTASAYSFDGLREKVEELAKEELEERKNQKDSASKRSQPAKKFGVVG